jgi:hypothetical protein
MRRLVRGLENLGLVIVDSATGIALTDMGQLLRKDVPGSMRDVALHGAGDAFAGWSKLEHAVRTGEPAFQLALGEPFFDFLRHDPEAGAAFDGMMTRLSASVIESAASGYDFASASRVLDIAGGRGHFLAAVLDAHMELEGAVFDVPEAGPSAAQFLAGRGLADRCKVISGSFFDGLPSGYDVHLLKWILHDWNDEDCVRILTASRRALAEGGRLLIVERLVPDTLTPSQWLHPAIGSDLTMLVNFGDAAERSLAEFEALLAASGFALEGTFELPVNFTGIDCRPV